jgi:intraflagellar transport protein 140
MRPVPAVVAALLQLDAHNISIEHVDGACVHLETEARIAGCDLFGHHLLVWTTRNVFIYQYDDSTARSNEPSPPVLLNSFEHRCTAAAIYKETVFLSAPGRVDVATFHGSIIATLPFADSEGTPTHMHLAANAKACHLVAGTDKGFIKAWEVSRKEPRQHAAGRRLGEGASPMRIAAVCISTDGNRIAATLDVQPPNPAASKSVIGPSSKVPQFLAWRPDGKLHVFIVDTDVAVSHDFSSHGRTPSAFHWEQSDPKFIGVETRPGPHSVAPPQLPVTVPVTGTAAMAAPTITAVVGDHDDSGQRQLEVTTLFCTPEGDLRLKDSFAPPEGLSSLIATQVPHYYFLGASQETPADVSDECGVPSSSTTASPGRTLAGKDSESTRRNVRRLRGVVMRDFIGMEVADEATRRALVDFSYYLTVGNLDEAHKAVKLVKSAAVWQVRSYIACAAAVYRDSPQLCTRWCCAHLLCPPRFLRTWRLCVLRRSGWTSPTCVLATWGTRGEPVRSVRRSRCTQTRRATSQSRTCARRLSRCSSAYSKMRNGSMRAAGITTCSTSFTRQAGGGTRR